MGVNNTGGILKKLIEMPNNPNDCWQWIGSTNKKTGYGKKQLDGKSILAHRWVYTIFNGYIEEGKVVDHLCRNRRCVNPTHLEVVTQTENCRRGKTTRLNKSKVIEIVNLLKFTSYKQVDIANKYDVSYTTISDIKSGKSWSDVTGFKKKERVLC